MNEEDDKIKIKREQKLYFVISIFGGASLNIFWLWVMMVGVKKYPSS